NWKRRTELVEYCVHVVDQSLNEKRSVVEDETLDSKAKRKVQGHIYEEQVKRTQVRNELRVEAIIRRRAVDVAPFAANSLRFSPLFALNRAGYPSFSEVKVPVQLGVMSRCPDALLCENVFNEVLPKVSDKIDLSMVYVAKLDREEEIFGVKCLHGPEECAGNVQQLCIAKHEPSFWWQFVQCQNYEGRNRIGDPDLTLKCAQTVGIDWEKSKAASCIGADGSGTGKEGVSLLKESVVLGKELGITFRLTR
ncbi:hypothetical protein H0H93_002394, partial [Arthromyces matolae]